MTQEEFAAYGFAAATIRTSIGPNRMPDRAFMKVITAHPKVAAEMVTA